MYSHSSPTATPLREVQAKYPESASFAKRIAAAGAVVAHCVNACDLALSRLPPAVQAVAPCHHIMFHHPHLGRESVQMHRALLGHFFEAASAPEILREDGVVHVSLGGCQARDWQLEAQAARHGLQVALRTVRLLSPPDWLPSLALTLLPDPSISGPLINY